MNGSPAAPATHVAADLTVYLYWLQSKFLLQVVLGGGVLTWEAVGGTGAVVIIVGDAVVGTTALGLHP